MAKDQEHHPGRWRAHRRPSVRSARERAIAVSCGLLLVLVAGCADGTSACLEIVEQHATILEAEADELDLGGRTDIACDTTDGVAYLSLLTRDDLDRATIEQVILSRGWKFDDVSADNSIYSKQKGDLELQLFLTRTGGEASVTIEGKIG